MPCSRYRSAWYVSRKNPRPSSWTSGSINITPGRLEGSTRTSALVFEDAEQVPAIGTGLHGARQAREIAGRDVAHAVSDLLQTGDHQALTLFDRLNVAGRLHQRFVRAGVEPRDAPRQLFDVQLSLGEVRPVDVGDLELAARRRSQPGRDVHHLIVVEIQPGDGER